MPIRFAQTIVDEPKYGREQARRGDLGRERADPCPEHERAEREAPWPSPPRRCASSSRARRRARSRRASAPRGARRRRRRARARARSGRPPSASHDAARLRAARRARWCRYARWTASGSSGGSSSRRRVARSARAGCATSGILGTRDRVRVKAAVGTRVICFTPWSARGRAVARRSTGAWRAVRPRRPADVPLRAAPRVSALTGWYTGEGNGTTVSVIGWHTGTIGKIVLFLGLARRAPRRPARGRASSMPASVPESLDRDRRSARSRRSSSSSGSSRSRTLLLREPRGRDLDQPRLRASAIILAGLLEASEEL